VARDTGSVRTRLLVAGVVVALLAGAGAVLVLRDDGPTLDAADRDALAEAGEAFDPAAAVDALAADGERWARLVAAGGPELAALLDRSQGALGASADPVDVTPVLAPWLDGEPVDDEVLPALARWAWPVLAADVREDPARERATAVLARADEGDDERDAVAGAVVLARIHRAITSPADGDDALTAWRSDLASAAIQGDDGDSRARRSALVDGAFVDLPGTVAVDVLATWGDPGASTPVREALAERGPGPAVNARSVLTVACYLAVLDDHGGDVAAVTIAELARDAEDLVELEDDLLSSDDPALIPIGDPATLLLSA
jgi:hypothetical protein